MAQFAVGQPIFTSAPIIAVDAGLPVGTHRFQLVVVDSAGLPSRPDVRVVTVQPVVLVVQPVVVGPTVPVIDPIGPVVPPITPVT